jgi:hypothetical protein
MLSISRQVSISGGAISRGPNSTTAPTLNYALPFHPGDTLTCDDGGWDRVGTIALQWMRDGSPIPGETTNSYTIDGAADFGTIIRCRATCTDAKGAGTRESNPTPVIDFPQEAIQPPEIWLNVVGDYYELQNNAVWEQATLYEEYQWELNGSPEFEQTSGQYAGAATTGDTIQMIVTAHTEWYTVSVYSNSITL